MRLSARFLIAFLFIHIPVVGATGTEGVLTSGELQRCMENSNPVNVRLTEKIMADEKLNAPADLGSAHRLELKLEKLRCVYAALEAYSFGIELSVEGVEAVREYRLVISQLALFSGSKHFELERLEGSQSCHQPILEERELCLKARRIHLIHGQAMVDAIDDFVAGYTYAIEKQPKLWLNRLELRVERTVREKIKQLTERVAATPTPASLH